ncbi:class II aldolase/adducin family protein [Alicyclobacillus sp. TC]|uniref:L-fuculose-phosphate aldolase n=2 Tax=Alicyclobacillus tolerans TaxID=90970 RepID=A0A1M6MSV2_9BACL|nr:MULTISPECIES: class II aldolase/adducin family protein [Alicyclobacillus]MDP9728111.1 L-fuculose-phosphate aldolase [Alicyclobacillus tengchongensis]QRF23340.1 class II aldolase/adducin family protein [Alicyclobacillus sp. TC]SHJ86469.1 L-fuculose-phosphate aldolase [Alicyclobacillus montanus]
MVDIQESKQNIINAANLLRDAGLMFRGFHANLSARLSSDTMLMTRGGNVANLDEDSFAVIRTDGTVLEGEVMPAQAEIIQMHAAVYRARESVGGIIHTHAPNATAFAIAHEPIPVVYEPLMRFGMTEPAPVIKWAPRGSNASVNGIVEAVKLKPGISAVLLANHGVLAFGKSPVETAQLLATLDEGAELILKARLIGGEKSLPEQAFQQIEEHKRKFENIHS